MGYRYISKIVIGGAFIALGIIFYAYFAHEGIEEVEHDIIFKSND